MGMFATRHHQNGNIGIPQNGSVSESSAHTSGHKLIKSTPQDIPLTRIRRGKSQRPAKFPLPEPPEIRTNV